MPDGDALPGYPSTRNGAQDHRQAYRELAQQVPQQEHPQHHQQDQQFRTQNLFLTVS